MRRRGERFDERVRGLSRTDRAVIRGLAEIVVGAFCATRAADGFLFAAMTRPLGELLDLAMLRAEWAHGGQSTARKREMSMVLRLVAQRMAKRGRR